MDPSYTYISELQRLLDQLPLETVNEVITTLREARFQGVQIFIMGNGGSASTASHFVCDLLKGTRVYGLPPYRVIGLADNMAVVSAYANDEGYENVFAYQLASLVQPGDVVIGISASGRSPNVINAIEVAKAAKAITIAFTGFDGGFLGSLVDINVLVPSNCIEHIEDVHLMLEHLICKVLREEADYSPASRELLFDYSHDFALRLNLHDLLRRILRLTVEGLGASSGSIIVLNKSGTVIEGAVAYGGKLNAKRGQGFTEVFERGLAGWVFQNREPALILNTSEDPRWLRRSWDDMNGTSRSAVSVPLMVNEHVVGVLTLVHTQLQFSKEDLALLTAITVCMSLVDYVTEQD